MTLCQQSGTDLGPEPERALGFASLFYLRNRCRADDFVRNVSFALPADCRPGT